MVFSSGVFIFIFLPVCILFYYAIPPRLRLLRNLLLLAMSLFFYFYGEPKGIFVMLTSIASNYAFSLMIDRSDSAVVRRAALVAAVVVNFAMLGFYKYTGFVLYNIERLTGIHTAFPEIVMPIGISFFTFQGMSYVFDVYKQDAKAQRTPLNVALYISMFPQLVAGPIVRYEDIERELTDRIESFDLFAVGVRRFIFGLSKKMLLANSLGALASDVFASNSTGGLVWAVAWLGAIAYSFQIFFDFSGYSDMAIGMGHMFGFHFKENFDYPYVSRSITEFWRRWHISLGTWFRDYLYIPLGGSRRGLRRQILNLLVVWGFTGLWHGASWNFIAWGLYFAMLLIVEKLFLTKLLDKAPKVVGHIYALFFIVIGWVIFNGGGLTDIARYLRAMFTLAPMSPVMRDYCVFILRHYRVELVFALILSAPVSKLVSSKIGHHPAYHALCTVGTIVLFLLSIMSVVNTTFNPFIYFRF